MTLYVQFPSCPGTGAAPSPLSALDRAYESIRVLCDELEHAQREITARDAQLEEATERYEVMRSERDRWRGDAEAAHTTFARLVIERDDAVRRLALFRRRLAELAGETA
ncbi:hypothetical protein [Saccharopolyspora rosea]|uniref:Uncharacterized protein n=1 Tax=Saccharopolyspora rosea TaxID=524884 RepID=A0ABW3FM25_9PSEU|nr:hypothetical protein [Saccharopolyspora rosea]